MRITVHYMAQLRRLAGVGSEAIELPDASTLGTLLTCLADRHGTEFRGHLLAADAGPRPSLLFFVGDEPADAGRVLRDGDGVTILSPMAGG